MIEECPHGVSLCSQRRDEFVLQFEAFCHAGRLAIGCAFEKLELFLSKLRSEAVQGDVAE